MARELKKIALFSEKWWNNFRVVVAQGAKKFVKSNLQNCFRQIPLFAISKMAKNQFLKWEKVENCQKCNFTNFLKLIFMENIQKFREIDFTKKFS